MPDRIWRQWGIDEGIAAIDNWKLGRNDTRRILVCCSWMGNRSVNVPERKLHPPRIGRRVHVLVIHGDEEDVDLSPPSKNVVSYGKKLGGRLRNASLEYYGWPRLSKGGLNPDESRGEKIRVVRPGLGTEGGVWRFLVSSRVLESCSVSLRYHIMFGVLLASPAGIKFG